MLRELATSVDVEHDGLQKSKLIEAILDSKKFDPSTLPEEAVQEAPAKVVSSNDDARRD